MAFQDNNGQIPQGPSLLSPPFRLSEFDCQGSQGVLRILDPGSRNISLVSLSMQRSVFLITNVREGANREKLTVKKLIDNEMFFFFHRLCPLQTVKNRRKP